MKDIFLFIKQGWNNVWKQDMVWIFCAIPVFRQLIGIIHIKPSSGLPWILLTLIEFTLFFILSFIGYVGVPYIVYGTFVERKVSVKDVLFAVRKFGWRIIGLSCLAFIILSPLIYLTLVLSMDASKQILQISNKAIIILLFIAMLSSMWYFFVIGIFANDWSVGQTVRNAWSVFTSRYSHFWTLVQLGVVAALTYRVWAALAGIFTILIDKGFDSTSLSQLNYLNMYSSLGKNILFLFMDGIGRIIYTPLFASIFTAAYIKYSGEDTSLT